MIISTQLAKAFNKAVTSPENLIEDGSVNWNYVDADVHMDMLGKVPGNYAEQFDYLADCYAGHINPADRIVQQQDRMEVTNSDLILDPSKPAYIVRVI